MESRARWKRNIDTAAAESATLHHLENMIALLLASDTSEVFEIRAQFRDRREGRYEDLRRYENRR